MKKTMKKQLTMKQVLGQGKRVVLLEHKDGTSSDIREADGLIFDIMTGRDGYITGMWCMGKKTRVEREYRISLLKATNGIFV